MIEEVIATLDAAAPLEGAQVGPYRILSPLGAGGMGKVYRARDTKLGRDVAIKTLPSEFARNPERLARLRSEARTLASLNHPNIAAIYGLEEFGDSDWLVLELVEGQNLRGPLPIPEALRVAKQIAEALEAAHEKGIVHRDLKPANVRVTHQGRVKVLDFGLAKTVWVEGKRQPGQNQDVSQLPTETMLETLAGHVMGTPGYMSPEQARGQEVDRRTDIWAFGCVLYELLAGKRAFQGETQIEMIAAVLEREPDWQAVPAKTPAKIRELLRQCLQKDPERRLNEIADARKALDAAMGGWNRWKVAAIAGAAAVIAIAGVAAAVWPRNPLRPTDQSQWVQLTKFSDSVSQPALSPDGRMVAFIRGESTFYGPGQIYVKILPDSEPVQLTHDILDKMSPVFSPDGARIAYTTVNPDFQWDTWTVPVLGGEPQIMLKNASGLVWTGPRHILFSEIRMGVHMAVVTSEESRIGAARRLRSPGRTRYGAPLLSIARWEMGVAGGDGYRSLVGALPCGSCRRQFRRTQGRSAGRRLYIRRVVAGWEVDVLHIERGGRKSHLAAAFSRWQSGADHRWPNRRGRHRHGAGWPLFRHRRLAARRFPVASRPRAATGRSRSRETQRLRPSRPMAASSCTAS